MINRFIGKYKDFSNFSPSLVRFENLTFPTVEHAYVAAKSLDKSFRRDIALMSTNQAVVAKKWGRTVKLRDDWEDVKLQVMEDLVYQKFSIYPLQELLLDTGDQLLIEGNFWHDNYWGNCYCKKCKRIKGENHLGKILMKVREIYYLDRYPNFNVGVTS